MTIKTMAVFNIGSNLDNRRNKVNAPHEFSGIAVYQAINKVQADLATVGISKDRTNHQGSGYKFRGIDDVYNTLSRLLATHGLCILPRMISRTCEERQSKAGGALFYVTVEAEFDLVAAVDGSKHTVRTFGEAMDSGDKATNKAMSAAYKYAAFQAFAIPTEGDNDADATTHAVESRNAIEDAALLTQYQEAALNGSAALKAFHGIAKGDSKVRVWKAHSEALKAAAVKVDEAEKVTA